jgi:general stress protein YciG
MAKKPARPAAESTESAQRAPVSKEGRASHKRGPAPGTEEAKRGGKAVREKLGLEHYQRIGKMGGAAVKKRKGLDFYREIGQRGGEMTRQRHGLEHYIHIGHIGGSTKRRGSTEPKA